MQPAQSALDSNLSRNFCSFFLPSFQMGFQVIFAHFFLKSPDLYSHNFRSFFFQVSQSFLTNFLRILWQSFLLDTKPKNVKFLWFWGRIRRSFFPNPLPSIVSMFLSLGSLIISYFQMAWNWFSLSIREFATSFFNLGHLFWCLYKVYPRIFFGKSQKFQKRVKNYYREMNFCI